MVAMADHPHGRGENPSCEPVIGSPYGPSPRAWGKLCTENYGVEPVRTIPTGVGKTSRGHHPPHGCSDHPHGRGENGPQRAPRAPANGPSPRAWGKPFGAGSTGRSTRTIPTGVGKTPMPASSSLAGADHPHGRGENRVGEHRGERQFGPSPRAWGKRRHARKSATNVRTIPTGVGKTSRGHAPAGCSPDHPHGRGENEWERVDMADAIGPSPRAWGKLCAVRMSRAAPRTIPTGVGKTPAGAGRA